MQRTTLMLMIGCLTSAAMAQQPDTAHPASGKTPEGMMVPMMTDADMRSRPPKGQGELVFNKTERGFYYFDGTDWQALLHAEPAVDGNGVLWVQQRLGSGQGNNGILKLSSGTSGFWDLTGNATTDPAVNFIGTTDAQPLRFRVNNVAAGELGHTNTGVVSLGSNAGAVNTGGQNTYLGNKAGKLSTSAQGNTYVGYQTGAVNTTGSGNVFLGNVAGMDNTTGSENTFIGDATGQANTSGTENTALGRLAMMGGGTFTNATAIGARARVDGSNAMVLGSVAGVNGATSNVRVGIGTTDPLDALHVVGSMRMADGNQAAGRVLTSDANGKGNWQALPVSTIDWGRTGNAGTNATTDFIGTTDAADLRLRTNNATRLSVTSAGKIGIGTTAPAASLQVNGGLALQHIGNQALAGGVNNLAVGDRSLIRVIASVAGASVNLADGVAIGQILLVQNAGAVGSQNVSIADNTATSNCNLAAARTLGPGDTLSLMWDGLDWLELAFANN